MSFVPIQAGAFQFTFQLADERVILESRITDRVVMRAPIADRVVLDIMDSRPCARGFYAMMPGSVVLDSQ